MNQVETCSLKRQFTNWHLLYDNVNDYKQLNTVIVRDRLFRIARRILEKPASVYEFLFNGGEITKHYYLPELAEYILTCSPLSFLILETDGSAGFNYYRNLCHKKNRIILDLNLNNLMNNAEGIVRLIAELGENGIFVRASLPDKQSDEKELAKLANFLVNLRKIVPFEINRSYDSIQNASCKKIANDFVTTFSQISANSPALHKIEYNQEWLAASPYAPDENLIRNNKFICVSDFNNLGIFPDGRFKNIRCKRALRLPPLWLPEENWLKNAPYICECSYKYYDKKVCEPLRLFSNKEEAVDFFENYQKTLYACVADIAPVSMGSGEKKDLLRLLRLRLDKMEPASISGDIQIIEEAQANTQKTGSLFREYGSDILKIYKALSDDYSKELFLRILKIIVTADLVYFSLPSYPEHPIAPDAKFLSFEAKDFEELHNNINEPEIYLNHPNLRIKFSEYNVRFIQICSYILSLYPNYKIYLTGAEVSKFWVYFFDTESKAEYFGNLTEKSENNKKFSIIIPTYNNEQTIADALNSVLIQNTDSFEIIVVNDASTDGTPAVINELIEKYPGKIHCISLPANQGPGIGRNIGLQAANGDYIAFVDSDDMMAFDFLEDAAAIMEREKADIVAFDMIITEKDKRDQRWGVKAGTYQGLESLNQILTKNIGSYGVYAKLYRGDFIRKNDIRFGTSIVHEDTYFILKSFYLSQKTVVVEKPGYFRKKRTGSLSSTISIQTRFQAFIDCVYYTEMFFRCYGLSLSDEGYYYLIKRLYTWGRERYLKMFFTLKPAEVGTVLTRENIRKISTVKLLLDLLIRDFADLICYKNKLAPYVELSNCDWRKDASKEYATKKFKAYGRADNPANLTPDISIILPNYNKEKYIVRAVESILEQNFRNFELLIIDDHSTDASYGILKDYADLYPEIRLYRMDMNCRQGVCRNIGIEKSLGKYLIFVDSDDVMTENFLAHAYNDMEHAKVDIIFYSFRCEETDGKLIYTDIMDVEALSPQGWISRYKRGRVEAAPFAKVISSNFIKYNNIRFVEHVYHQDQFFLIDMLRHYPSALGNRFIAYIRIVSENSTIRPTSYRYLHVHSACRLYGLFNKFSYGVPRIAGELTGHCIWNLEHIFLPAVFAFIKYCGTLPLASSDYKLLYENEVFVRSLFKGFADFYFTSKVPSGILEWLPPHETVPATYDFVQEPLCTVIVAVYNQEKYIGRCLASITSQKLHSLEIIIIDDASTDRTLDICLEYMEKDGRIRVIQNKDNTGGCGGPRKLGLEICKGKYVTFVDSDDFIASSMLLTGVSEMQRDDSIDIVQFSSVINEDGKTNVLSSVSVPVLRKGVDFFRDYVNFKHVYWNAAAKIYRVDFIRKNKIYMPDFLFEDNVFISQAYLKAKKILVLPDVGYIQNRVLHTHSASKPVSYTRRHVLGYLGCAEWISNNITSTPELPDGDKLAYQKIKELSPHKRVLEYINTFHDNPISLFNENELGMLKRSPQLLRFILNDLSKLWLKTTNYKLSMNVHQQGSFTPPEGANAPRLITVKDNSKMKKPLISVVIPCWNVAPYLDKCLSSVFDQHIDDMEIILIEDCSTRDDTFNICVNAAESRNNVRMFRTSRNAGLGTVRNLGIEKARGRYITFVDSDDYMEAGFLAMALPKVVENKCEIATCVITNQYNDKTYRLHRPDIQVSSMQASIEHMEGKYALWGAYGRIFERKFIIENNLKFSHLIYEDEEFLLKAYALAKRHFYFDIPSYFSPRHRPDSLMNQKIVSHKYFLSKVYNLQKNLEIFENNYSGKDGQTLSRKYVDWIFHPYNVFKRDLLGYIAMAGHYSMPDPLTTEVLNILSHSGYFLEKLLRTYAYFYMNKEEKHE